MKVRKPIYSVCSLVLVASFATSSLVAPIIVNQTTTQAAAAAPSSSGYVTLDQFSGNPGQTLNVTGGGYNAGETVTVQAVAGNKVIATVTTKATATGDFSAAVSLPNNLPQGAVAIQAIGNTSGNTTENSYYVAPFAPIITTTYASNTPYSTVLVNGSGYAANEFVTVNLSGAVTRVQADAKGAFKGASLVIPNVKPSTYQLTATGEDSKAVAIDYFYVNGFYPSVFPSTYYLLPDETLAFGGSGFAPNETITVKDSVTGTVVSTFKASATGDFAAAGGFTVPFAYAGTNKTFVMTGATSQATGSVTVAFGKFNAMATPTEYYVQPGGSLSFNGTGFAKNEIVTISFNGEIVNQVTADEYGNFYYVGAVTVPTSLAGKSASYVLTGKTSGAISTATTSVASFNPQASPTAYYLMPGAKLAFNGTGFAPSELVNITQNKLVVSTTQADEYGNFYYGGELTMSYDAAGTSPSYTLTGLSSAAKITLTVSVGQLHPQIVLSDYYALPYKTYAVSGSEFAAGEKITASVDGKVVGSGYADEFGNVTIGDLIVPTSKLGYIVVSLSGATSKASVATNMTIGKYYPYTTSSSYYGLPGDSFDLTGHSFAPGEPVQLMSGTSVVATATTDADGEVTFTGLTIPFAISAEYNLHGTLSDANGAIAIGIGQFHPSVAADNYYVTPNSTITVTGNGFAPGESVTMAAGSTTQTVTTSAKGIASFSLVVPFATSPKDNTVAIIVTGASSKASATTAITLAPFSAQVSPSTYYATPTSLITFDGSGFVAGENVTISLNGSSDMVTLKADAKGNFTSPTMSLPYGTSAVYTISSDVSKQSQQLTIGLAEFYAGIDLNNYYGLGGSAITVSGNSFAANENVVLTFAGKQFATVTTDAKGAFSLQTTVPFSTASDKAIVATGQQSGAVAKTGFTVAQAYSSVELGKYAVPAGEAVTFIGSSYFAGEPVTITTNRTTGSYTFMAKADGSFTNSGFVLPKDLAAGELTLTITGEHSFTTNKITMYVQEPIQN